MAHWFVPKEELTADQLRAVMLDMDYHRVICGGPGSGKTLVLLHRAKHLSEHYNVPPHRFHIFVYTNSLKFYIRSALSRLRLPEDCTTNLDKWCIDRYRRTITDRLPWDSQGRHPDFHAIRRAVLESLGHSTAPIFDFVLVDEGQDLTTDAIRLLKVLARHVTLCIDNRQQIYDFGSDEAAILDVLRIKRTSLSFLELFRCCPYVTSLASCLIQNEDERRTFIKQAKTLQGERERPLMYIAKDAFDEKRRLAEILRVRLAKGERVAVLFPTKRQVHGYGKGLNEMGLEVEDQEDIDFQNDKPKLMAYPSAKGLTFDTVMMPRLVEGAFAAIDRDRLIRWLFVGITRATKWVYLSSCDGQEVPWLCDLTSRHDNLVTVQRWNERSDDDMHRPSDSDDLLDGL